MKIIQVASKASEADCNSLPRFHLLVDLKYKTERELLPECLA